MVERNRPPKIAPNREGGINSVRKTGGKESINVEVRALTQAITEIGLCGGQVQPSGFGGASGANPAGVRPINVGPTPAAASTPVSLSGGVPVTPNKKDPFADLSVF